MRYRIPRMLDRPKQLFFWEVDEVIPIVGLVGVGIISNMLFFSLVTGIIAAKVVKKLKTGKMDGVMFHLLHWYGVFNLRCGRKRNIFENIIFH